MKTILSLLLSYLVTNTIIAQNVGIGTTNPIHAKLEIVGSVGASVGMFGSDKNGVSIAADNAEIGFNYFYNGGTYTMKPGYGANIGMLTNTGDLYMGNFNGNQSTTDFGAINGYRQRITIKQNGNVGIGIVNPVSPLQILCIGTSAYQNPGLRLSFADGTYSSSWNIYPYQGTFGSLTGSLNFAYESTAKSYISGYDGSYNAISDSRLKKNITYYGNNNRVLDRIELLQPAHYLMKDEPETNKYHIGFISQDVAKVFPEVVTESNGIKMMNYSGLIPIAFEGIKELRAQVEELSSDKKLLEGRIKKLEEAFARVK
jgi:hypothetical protein